jgi:hypothetical protein
MLLSMTSLKGGQLQQVITMQAESDSMATGRALTTETEREYLRGEHGDQRMYEARSRVKARINERLRTEIELFENEAPGVLDELRDVVCEND